MPDIVDREAALFANETFRVAADKLAQAYYFAKQVSDEWVASSMGSKLTNTADGVRDGSAADGRHPITGIDANNIIDRLNELTADYEANANAKLNTILGVAVRTGA